MTRNILTSPLLIQRQHCHPALLLTFLYVIRITDKIYLEMKDSHSNYQIVDVCSSTCWRQNSSQYIDESWLSCSWVSQDTRDLSFKNVEVKTWKYKEQEHGHIDFGRATVFAYSGTYCYYNLLLLFCSVTSDGTSLFWKTTPVLRPCFYKNFCSYPNTDISNAKKQGPFLLIFGLSFASTLSFGSLTITQGTKRIEWVWAVIIIIIIIQ